MEITMPFTITSSKTPILAQQPPDVRNAAQQFVQNYLGKNSVKVRAEWGELLERIQKNLRCVILGKGKSAHTLDEKRTFQGICRELNVTRSTAYNYIDTYIAFQSYPQAIQDAAFEAGLNLALPHVMAAYQKLEHPTNPSSLEIKGIIAHLHDAEPEDKDDAEEADELTKPLTEKQFKARLAKLVARAQGSELSFRFTVGSLIAASFDARTAYQTSVDEAVTMLRAAWEARFAQVGTPADFAPMPEVQ
jgi:hypothetical protein